MRVTIDTGILVRMNVRAKGPARELLRYLRETDSVLVLSQFLLDEVSRVFKYPRMRELFALTDAEIQAHVEALAEISELVTPAEGSPVVLTDPNDDPVIYTAFAGNADYLCTVDKDFYQPNVMAFCSRYGIQLVHDVELLHILRQSMGRSS